LRPLLALCVRVDTQASYTLTGDGTFNEE